MEAAGWPAEKDEHIPIDDDEEAVVLAYLLESPGDTPGLRRTWGPASELPPLPLNPACRATLRILRWECLFVYYS